MKELLFWAITDQSGSSGSPVRLCRDDLHPRKFCCEVKILWPHFKIKQQKCLGVGVFGCHHGPAWVRLFSGGARRSSGGHFSTCWLCVYSSSVSWKPQTPRRHVSVLSTLGTDGDAVTLAFSPFLIQTAAKTATTGASSRFLTPPSSSQGLELKIFVLVHVPARSSRFSLTLRSI